MTDRDPIEAAERVKYMCRIGAFGCSLACVGTAAIGECSAATGLLVVAAVLWIMSETK